MAFKLALCSLALLATSILAQSDADGLRFTGLPTTVVGGERYSITWIPVDTSVGLALYDQPNSSGQLVTSLSICATSGRYQWDTNENIPNGTYYMALSRCAGDDSVQWSGPIEFATASAPGQAIDFSNPGVTTTGASTSGPTDTSESVTGNNINGSSSGGDGGGGGGLSTAAKVGLGVGIGLGVPLLILAVVLGFFLGRRKGKKASPIQQDPAPPQYSGKTQEATGGNAPASTSPAMAAVPTAVPQQNVQPHGWTGQNGAQSGYQNQTTTTSSYEHQGYGNHEMDAGYQGHTELSTQR